jgi:hypothetical protein
MFLVPLLQETAYTLLSLWNEDKLMQSDFCHVLVEDFLRTLAKPKSLGLAMQNFTPPPRNPVCLFRFKDNQRVLKAWMGTYFFCEARWSTLIRSLTVEEIQGILGSRLLEVCGNYFYENGFEPQMLTMFLRFVSCLRNLRRVS